MYYGPCTFNISGRKKDVVCGWGEGNAIIILIVIIYVSDSPARRHQHPESLDVVGQIAQSDFRPCPHDADRPYYQRGRPHRLRPEDVLHARPHLRPRPVALLFPCAQRMAPATLALHVFAQTTFH